MQPSRATASTPAQLPAQLRAICGDRHVITERAHLRVYARNDAPPPPLAVLPGSVAEVQGVVRTCRAFRSRIVVRGAGTGSELPVAGTLLVLTRMRRILRVDRDRGEASAEVGAPLAAVARALGFHADDAVATVGGAVAAGSVAAHVLTLSVVVADGSLLRLRRAEPGYDLLAAFTGSRGAFGVVVRVDLRVCTPVDVPLDATGAERGQADLPVRRRLADAFDPDGVFARPPAAG